jgi:HEAT repeat protein
MIAASLSSLVFIGCAPKAKAPAKFASTTAPIGGQGPVDGVSVGYDSAADNLQKMAAVLDDKTRPETDRISAAVDIGNFLKSVQVGLRSQYAKKALPILRAHLRDENHYVGMYAAVAVLKAEPDDKEAVAALTGYLESFDPTVRGAAANELGSYRRQPSMVIPALVEALKDEDARVRVMAAQSLGFYGPQAASAVPALTKALSDHDKDVRLHAAQALGEMPKDAGSAVPARQRLLSDGDYNVATQARQALDDIQREQSGKR